MFRSIWPVKDRPEEMPIEAWFNQMTVDYIFEMKRKKKDNKGEQGGTRGRRQSEETQPSQRDSTTAGWTTARTCYTPQGIENCIFYPFTYNIIQGFGSALI
jgi:hypothetical protein